MNPTSNTDPLTLAAQRLTCPDNLSKYIVEESAL